MQGCVDFMRLWRNFMPRQFSSMIFYYHLFIGEVRTIRNETTYPIHGKYPLNLNNTKKRMHQNCDASSFLFIVLWRGGEKCTLNTFQKSLSQYDSMIFDRIPEAVEEGDGIEMTVADIGR